MTFERIRVGMFDFLTTPSHEKLPQERIINNASKFVQYLLYRESNTSLLGDRQLS